MSSEPDARIVTAAQQPSLDQVWAWLDEVEDPEIPVISIVDLGIVRGVRCTNDDQGGAWVVTITPTYSGCPATHVIAQSVIERLAAHGLHRVQLETRIAPAWTTDWMSEDGKRKLRQYGIAPPVGLASEQSISIADIGRGPRPHVVGVGAVGAIEAVPSGLACPRCGSTEVSLTSQFGSTPCKALYRCNACLEPFDYFKCH
jgi:ring-1,2-phenylacetyl-CoA epoxidase subunit PaaD